MQYQSWNSLLSFKRKDVILLCLFWILEDDSESHFVRWEDDGNVTHGTPIPLQDTPFFIVGHRLMECHQGPGYKTKNNDQKVSTCNFIKT